MLRVVLLFAAASALHAQFDAASLKPSQPGGRAGRLPFTPGRIFGTNVTGRQILLEAYRLKSYQLSGGPAWLDSARFDLEAKADTPASENQLRTMLQTLLGERFKLVVHREMKDMPVYGLKVAKSGLRLREVKEGEPKPPPPRPEPGALMAEYSIRKMQDFVDSLSRVDEIGRPVLNQTGLDGTYAFDMQLFQGEDFLSMVQERSGLRFESQRASIEILVIDRMERPEEN